MPSKNFGNQKPKQVLAHLKSHLNKKLQYYVKISEDCITVVEARNRQRKKAEVPAVLKILGGKLDDECRYNLTVGNFNASATIKPTYSKERSARGQGKDKLNGLRGKMKKSDVKKFSTKKSVKPKIRSQKAGHRMVKLKGQPGC